MTPRALSFVAVALLAVGAYPFRWLDWAWGRFCDIYILCDADFHDIQRLGYDGRKALLKKLWWECRPLFVIGAHR